MLQALVLALMLVATTLPAASQSSADSHAGTRGEPVKTLERNFFAALRSGESDKVLSYVPKDGVNVGPQAQHISREEIQQQLKSHRGLYCKLFDSSCINAEINVGGGGWSCSYRQLLSHSEKVHTASSEVTRNNVRQAVLVARVQNAQCPNDRLIDFIFNLEADGWKLFSIP